MVHYEWECRLQQCTNLHTCNADTIKLEKILGNTYLKLNADRENKLRRAQPIFEVMEGDNEKGGNIVIAAVYSICSKISE
jgi:hypothetical protein